MGSQAELISSIHNIVKDYRKGEWGIKEITNNKIKDWVKQFEPKHRKLVLTEFHHILKKRYYSKRRIKSTLINEIICIGSELGFKSTKSFLKHVTFINVQPQGKSQDDLLRLIDDILVKRFSIGLKKCGSLSHRYSVYVDDMLCTGQTLQRDMIEWSNMKFSCSKITNKLALERGRTKLILIYLFCHIQEYQNKVFQIRNYHFKSFDPDLYCKVAIDNTERTSNNELMIPCQKILSKKIIDYRDQVNAEVDEHLSDKKYKVVKSRFFRKMNFPKKEKFFSSARTRDAIEKIFLTKGIDIAENAVNRTTNIRPLGYALPSTRNFGFGALCFTYRNISNNTPLVLWYSLTSFRPLFEKR